LSQPFEINNKNLTISSSIGIAVYPENGSSATELLNCADVAMYSAKGSGKNRVKYCTDDMTTQMHSLVETERNLRKALENEEFILHFQPQVDLVTRDIIRLEALVRWQNPQQGLIYPKDFIPLAEDRGIIHDISKWVIRNVFYHLKLWKNAGCKLVPVMVNLSARDFFLEGIEKFIVEIFSEEVEFLGLFGIEVTETSIMVDREYAITTLNKLQDMGVKIALDDFGTGYSSLNYLKYLPIDIVKIDRSFIKNITNSIKDAVIIESIVSMSHTLNLKVVAEGIETVEQFEYMRKIQCDQAQGYFFYKPLPDDEICSLLLETAR
jgi:EAL domain-containing protein (putative c-di-GMP-specific phosphodiesterase class I)